MRSIQGNWTTSAGPYWCRIAQFFIFIPSHVLSKSRVTKNHNCVHFGTLEQPLQLREDFSSRAIFNFKTLGLDCNVMKLLRKISTNLRLMDSLCNGTGKVHGASVNFVGCLNRSGHLRSYSGFSACFSKLKLIFKFSFTKLKFTY